MARADKLPKGKDPGPEDAAAWKPSLPDDGFTRR